jgi:hypothetical protein
VFIGKLVTDWRVSKLGLDDFAALPYHSDILETTSFGRFLEEKRVEPRSTLFLSKNLPRRF